MSNDVTEIQCPVCGDWSVIEKHAARKLAAGKDRTKIYPAGESFYCSDFYCGFYVEVAKQGVLEDLFKTMKTPKFKETSCSQCGQDPAECSCYENAAREPRE